MSYICKNYTTYRKYSGVHCYHFHRGKEMNLPKNYSVKKGRIGVELETEFLSLAAASDFAESESNWFYLEHDGSIGVHGWDGIEIITVPLRPSDATNPTFWSEELTSHIAADARSWDTNGRCGLHVHVGNERLGGHPLTIQENQAKLIYFHEHFLKGHDITKAVCGRGRSYHEVNGMTEMGVEMTQKRDLLLKSRKLQEELTRATRNGTNTNLRYHAINITNSATTEFRLGKGSLNPQRIAAVVEWCDLQCAYVRTHNWGQLSLEDFFLYLSIRASDNLKRFLAPWVE